MYIASINLRISADVDGENSWVYRKLNMIEFIKEHAFDIIGCQEASPSMVQDLKNGLSDFYEFIFHPRDQRGEGTPILYKRGMKVLDKGTFWLSETPHQESIVDGSHFPRICTYVKFKDLIFFNTHLDYVSDDVCLVQAHHLVNRIKSLSNRDDHIIVTGDFNMYPSSKTIQYMSQHFVHDYQNQNRDQLTYHGYTKEVVGDPIDYIFHTTNVKTGFIKIHRDHIDGRFLSDHYPIATHIYF